MKSYDIMLLWEGEKPKGLGIHNLTLTYSRKDVGAGQSFVSFGTLKSLLQWNPSNSFNKGHLLY